MLQIEVFLSRKNTNILSPTYFLYGRAALAAAGHSDGEKLRKLIQLIISLCKRNFYLPLSLPVTHKGAQNRQSVSLILNFSATFSFYA